jgi:hypothetical protein
MFKFRMSKSIEGNFQVALELYQSGLSIIKAADARRISRTTFKARLHGRVLRKEAHKDEHKLSVTQKKRLHEWILIQDELGCPVTHQQIRNFASQVAQ